MKYAAKLFLLFTLCLFLSDTAFASDTQPSVISINGNGSVQGAPDTATISLGVITRAQTASEAQNDNALATRKVRDALFAFGISKSDIQTQNFNFHTEFGRSNGNSNEVIGYVVSNTILIKTHDVTSIGEIIDIALSNGANTINSLNFLIKDTTDLRNTALKEAIKDAKDKAEIIAKALGKKIIGIQSVTENTNMFQPRNAEMMLMATGKAMDSTPIEAGTLTLTADVHIDFIIEN